MRTVRNWILPVRLAGFGPSRPLSLTRLLLAGLLSILLQPCSWASLQVTALRCEYLENPMGVEDPAPRLSWKLTSKMRGARQTAYQILVASTAKKLKGNHGDLWDSGRVTSDETVNIPYAGKPLPSGQACFWKVQVWDQADQTVKWSEPAQWSMGLLHPQDWKGRWISYRDTSPVHASREQLYLPPTQMYRKDFKARKNVARATVYASALGIYDLYLNGQRASESLFSPGWSDYLRRVYYNVFDVTDLLKKGENTIGSVVADGWYAGYVGYGLLVGYGPNKAGRCFYGKTPAFLAQLDVEYTDGSHELIVTDNTWKTSNLGPWREADLIMGETYDARMEQPGWCRPAFPAKDWQAAIYAEENGSSRAVFSDTTGNREVELGFVKPPQLQAYPTQPIRVIQELPAQAMIESKPGVYIFDLGRNFAGMIRLNVAGPAGTRIQVRYGEMLHPDGRLMTENLRRARATDTYILRGDSQGEVWTPRFTYHGFQYVELSGLGYKPGKEAVTGLVAHSDTPLTSRFECSDTTVNQLFRNILTTQRANFVEIPTDCPQRDERLGWMGDAQVYVRTATFNADVAAFFTKWMYDVEEAQRPFGAYPDYCPYPMSHGEPGKTFGTAWMDAGIICPWTIHRVYGDTRILERHWNSMTRFMEFRQTSSPNRLGVSIGNPWGDWLSLNQVTPVEYVDICYFALTARQMSEMAAALNKPIEVAKYDRLFKEIQAAYTKEYVQPDGTLKIETQTACVLALWVGLIPESGVAKVAAQLVANIEKNDGRMATGFLGTKPLLTVLTRTGHHDLAVRLFQSREFPSWCYEVVNGATSVWERWDSYTKEDGFGRHNAAMNSFSHYSFGAVCEWMFQSLAGMDTDGPGYKRIVIRPGPPKFGDGKDFRGIDWVRASYDSIRGPIRAEWRRGQKRFELHVTVPPGSTATVYVPALAPESITEGTRRLDQSPGVRYLHMENDHAILQLESGDYEFASVVADW